MGLISGLLLFPITGPVKGLEFVLEQVRNEAEAELLDEGRIRAEIVNLIMLRDADEISDEEYAAQEELLLEHLNQVRAYKEGLVELVSDDEDVIVEIDTGEEEP